MERFFQVGFLIGWLLCGASCDSTTTPDEDAYNANPRTDNFEAQEPGKSRFLDEVGKQEYSQAEPPSESPLFRWDFSEKGVAHEYSYEQEVRILMDMGSGDEEEMVSAEGIILVRSQGDASAELVMKDVTMTMSQGDSDPIQQNVPPMVLQGMGEDGSGPFGNQSQDMFLKILFTLPAERMAVGESIQLPMNMPYNLNGSALMVKGHSKVTLTRYVTIDGGLCAEFEVETDISEFKAPPEIEGDYAVTTRGKSVLYFDVRQRCFVNGTIALLMETHSDAPRPQFDESSRDEEDESEWQKTSIVMDNLIKLRLKR